MLGSPWGIEDASCPNRDNPPVPTWHASATLPLPGRPRRRPDRLREAGLVVLYDPPRTFDGRRAAHRSAQPQPRPRGRGGRPGGLEPGRPEPDRAARRDARPDRRDPLRPLREGGRDAHRRVHDACTTQGAPGHFPTDAVAIWLAAPGLDDARTRRRGSPTAARSWRSATSARSADRPVDANGDFMDFDGADQPDGPDVDTRGMLVCGLRRERSASATTSTSIRR